MAGGERRFIAFAAVFTVSDVSASLAFYRDRLGFEANFLLGEPPDYAIIERDAVSLHLMPVSQEGRGLGRSSIYIFTPDVDALHAELQALGCPIEKAPANYDYGMREASVRDPDGNRITFGQEIKPPA